MLLDAEKCKDALEIPIGPVDAEGALYLGDTTPSASMQATPWSNAGSPGYGVPWSPSKCYFIKHLNSFRLEFAFAMIKLIKNDTKFFHANF